MCTRFSENRRMFLESSTDCTAGRLLGGTCFIDVMAHVRAACDLRIYERFQIYSSRFCVRGHGGTTGGNRITIKEWVRVMRAPWKHLPADGHVCAGATLSGRRRHGMCYWERVWFKSTQIARKWIQLCESLRVLWDRPLIYKSGFANCHATHMTNFGTHTILRCISLPFSPPRLKSKPEPIMGSNMKTYKWKSVEQT